MVMSSRFEIICNLFVYAGQVPLSRVHFDPKQESDCLENFKIICSTFRKLDIDKVIDNIGGLRRIIQCFYYPECGCRPAGEAEVPRQLAFPPLVQEVL